MKTLLIIIIFCFIFNGFLTAQTISGNFSQLPNQEIRLEGFNGLNTFPISKTIINENGLFELSYSNDNRGVGYLLTLENQPLFVILSGENIEIMGEALNFPEAITITKGKQNQIYQQYIKEQYMREQVLSAWYFLQKIYTFDSLLTIHKEPVKAINEELRESAERGDTEPDVNLVGLDRADFPYFALLEDTQQSRLCFQWQFSDLVKEECAAVGSFDQPSPCRRRAGKSAFLMTEQV